MKDLSNISFYYIRHGETDANKNQLMCGGDWDIELNETGIAQAKEASLMHQKHLDGVDKVFISPMKRTIHTANLFLGEREFDKTILEGLREWKVGTWESKPWTDVPNPFHTDESPPGGESKEEFSKRVIDTISNALKENSGKICLFVSHGAVAHILFTHLGIDVPYIKNATLYKVFHDGSAWNLADEF